RRPVIEDAPVRTAYEIALENAVEGCVRETFGALVGAHQALRASDPSIA
ncbi:MAG: ferritin-like domain-containing protein, partial [Actinobacteria bacterium]|nr:ferritin-like domain-containing protein [Actinomycetota bacterium]NIU71284.1 ferritin-like domain-containing protein [Actinomycetota bacterium]